MSVEFIDVFCITEWWELILFVSGSSFQSEIYMKFIVYTWQPHDEQIEMKE